MEPVDGASEAGTGTGMPPDADSGPGEGAAGEADGPPPRETTCCRCSQAVTGRYFTAGGLVWCGDCAGAAETALRGRVGFGGFLRAAVLGYLAAVLAGGLWALITIKTGYQLGIVAIAVGLMVGHAVRVGGRRRGGRVLQLLAVALTFLGLSYSTVPLLIHELRESPDLRERFLGAFSETDESAEGRELPADTVQEKGMPPTADTGLGSPVGADGPGLDGPGEGTGAGEEAEPPTGAQAVLALMLLAFAVVLAGPVFIYVLSLTGDPFSLLFLAIALWEAWKINRSVRLAFQGPYEVSPEIDFDHVDLAGS